MPSHQSTLRRGANVMLKLMPLSLAIAAALSGCSDGGSASASTSGSVIGSYFRNANVCLDQNNNGACDAGEPSTRTDANGAFTLSGSGPVVAEIGTDAVEYDPASGTSTPVTGKIVLRAPKEAPTLVSVQSTAVVAEMEDNGLTFDAALLKVAAAMNISKDKLLGDFNKETDAATKAALKSASDDGLQRIQTALAGAKAGDDPRKVVSGATGSLDKIKNVVVIYAENRSFDNLYGLFPGANGISNALKDPRNYQQLDRDGSVLAHLPGVWNASATQAGSWSFVSSLENKPFLINAAQPGGAPGVDASVTSPDLVHRYYNNQMQINGGANNMFAAWSDAGGLSMGYYDGSSMAMWKLAQQYTLADNFYMGAFGGSFLNHFWLVCACTPSWNTAPASRLSSVDLTRTPPMLAQAASSPVSALTGKPVFSGDFNFTPQLGGTYYAINTTQPPYQPSGTAPATGGDPALADPAGGGAAGSIPLAAIDSNTTKTIGDTLTAKSIDWKWYAGAWNTALANRTEIYGGSSNFQPHHQPFNYFKRFDPTTAAGQAERGAHLKDYTDLVADAAAGTLPPVAFYKPQGSLNQHPGYTDIMSGDAHIADVIAKLKASPQWKNMLVVVTYDENGGFWDHAAPPKGDQWGPGSRIPAIVISPYAKTGYVDSTPYDTTSILKFITRRFGLDPLPGVRKMVGDLSNSLDLTK